MEWVKCSDCLPQDKQLVIVYDGNDLFFATFNEKKDKRLKKRQGDFYIHGDDFWVEVITHWMICPDYPKRE
jgi:hypothetical protein